MEIKLLAAPVVLPPASGATADSTSLVPVSRLHAVNQAVPRLDSAYPSDSYVWSVLARDNGSFHFYAVPLKNFLSDGGSSRQNDFLSPYLSSPDWNTTNAGKAVAQYQLHASVAMPMCGHLLNVYA
jgi:hypothetical protein